MSTRWRARVSILTAFTLALALGACGTWRASPLPPARVIAEQDPDYVRLHRPGRATVSVLEPQLIGDSIVGTAGRGRVSTPLSDVTAIDVRGVSAGRTILLLIPVVLVTVPAVGLFVGCALGDCSRLGS